MAASDQSLPAGPRLPPVVQTLRWLVRPIAFLEACRRELALRPIMGPRSVLLLEGRDHLARRRLMLPPFHGERMRAYEPIVRDVVAAEVESWPEDELFAIHPR